MPGPSSITTRQKSTPSLLRLSWNGHPLYYDKTYGWSYIIKKQLIDEQVKIEIEKLFNNSTLEKSKKNKTDRKIPTKILANGEEYAIIKIPHKVFLK